MALKALDWVSSPRESIEKREEFQRRSLWHFNVKKPWRRREISLETEGDRPMRKEKSQECAFPRSLVGGKVFLKME